MLESDAQVFVILLQVNLKVKYSTIQVLLKKVDCREQNAAEITVKNDSFILTCWFTVSEIVAPVYVEPVG